MSVKGKKSIEPITKHIDETIRKRELTHPQDMFFLEGAGMYFAVWEDRLRLPRDSEASCLPPICACVLFPPSYPPVNAPARTHAPARSLYILLRACFSLLPSFLFFLQFNISKHLNFELDRTFYSYDINKNKRSTDFDKFRVSFSVSFDE